VTGAPGWAVDALSPTPARTRSLAGSLAALARPGDVVLLTGGLGAGKTTFAQGFCGALGVTGPVTSPTFTLVHQYRCAPGAAVEVVVHADVYRLTSLAEIADLALDELVEDGAVGLVEWGDAAAPVLGPDALVVDLALADGDPAGPGDDTGDDTGADPGPVARRLTVHGRGERWARGRDAVARALGAAAEGAA
jgi:tRNA threonylcarbamoyladenosine biosynthesis protein TsaE